jgi:hypothetical protein
VSLNYRLDKLHNLYLVRAMSDETTQNIDGKRSFEERVFTSFDALESTLRDMNGRLEKLEARSYDTKPIWEQALKEIIETRRELSKRLDRIEAIAH